MYIVWTERIKVKMYFLIILETVSFSNKTINIQLTYELDLHKF